MRTIPVQQQPNTKADGSNPGEARDLPEIDAAEPNARCNDMAADADRMPIAGAPPPSEKLEVPEQPFVLQFLVMKQERPAAELAKPVRHASETGEVWSAGETGSKERGTVVPGQKS